MTNKIKYDELSKVVGGNGQSQDEAYDIYLVLSYFRSEFTSIAQELDYRRADAYLEEALDSRMNENFEGEESYLQLSRLLITNLITKHPTLSQGLNIVLSRIDLAISKVKQRLS